MQSRFSEADNELCTAEMDEVSEQLSEVLDKLDQVG